MRVEEAEIVEFIHEVLPEIDLHSSKKCVSELKEQIIQQTPEQSNAKVLD